MIGRVVFHYKILEKLGKGAIGVVCRDHDLKFECGPLKIDVAFDITLQVAQGIAKAHEHAIVPRDIKPASTFINSDGEAKTLDFGPVY